MEYENPQEEFGRLDGLAFILPSPVAVLMAQAEMLSYFKYSHGIVLSCQSVARSWSKESLESELCLMISSCIVKHREEEIMKFKYISVLSS